MHFNRWLKCIKSSNAPIKDEFQAIKYNYVFYGVKKSLLKHKFVEQMQVNLNPNTLKFKQKRKVNIAAKS